MRIRLSVIVILLLLAGCATDAACPEIRVRHLPPTKADVIEAAIRMYDEPLEGHDWCDGLVNETEPHTLGRYLAGLISWQEQGDVNWTEVTIHPRESPAGKWWQANVMFVGGDGGESLWGYGVYFMIRGSDGLVIASSFVCPGTP
jgi:hypothetical protein